MFSRSDKWNRTNTDFKLGQCFSTTFLPHTPYTNSSIVGPHSRLRNFQESSVSRPSSVIVLNLLRLWQEKAFASFSCARGKLTLYCKLTSFSNIRSRLSNGAHRVFSVGYPLRVSAFRAKSELRTVSQLTEKRAEWNCKIEERRREKLLQSFLVQYNNLS